MGVVREEVSIRSRRLRAIALSIVCIAAIDDGVGAATFSEPGFEDTLFSSGLSSPTAIEFSPDGMLFVAEQAGRLRVIDPTGQLQPEPFLQLSVISSNERGLLGVDFDPNYLNNGYVYVYYTSADTGLNTVSRFTKNSDTPLTGDPASELKILEVASATGYHNGGAIHFGLDGMLYIGVGDAHTSSNAQDLSNLLGKLLRIDPASYPNIVPADNPFVTTPGARGEIWTLGLRNPFTFAIDPVSTKTHINDVGQATWEEIDRGSPGANYGWPTCEGACSDSRFVNPVYAYSHSEGCAITGGTFYRANGFPPHFDGSYFFADYCSDWIRRLDESDAMHPFATGVSRVVDLKVGPDGALYFVSRSSNSVRRVAYVGAGNQSPTAVAEADPTSGAAPLFVTFNGEQSSDPDGDPLTHTWNFGDGSATAQGEIVTHTYVSPGEYTATLTVDDSRGGTDTTTVPISVGTPPVATIIKPVEGTLYSGGEEIHYEGQGTDAEDGDMPAPAFSWTIVFHHDDHTHPFLGPIDGVRSGTFTIPKTGETAHNVWYRIHLTVTDASGLQDTTYRDILPRKVTLSFETVPPGLEITLDGQPRSTPSSVIGVVGIYREIGAPSPQTVDGRAYVWESWSDGGEQTHIIDTPDVDTIYTALYRDATPLPAPQNLRRTDTVP